MRTRITESHARNCCDSLCRGPGAVVRHRSAVLCRYTPAWQSHVLAHLPFYFRLLPMYLDLVTHTASVAAQQAAKHLRRVGRVRPRGPHPCLLTVPHPLRPASVSCAAVAAYTACPRRGAL